MKKINFHTHTFHCTHAIGTVDEYCQKAAELDFIALGFSEHVPYKDGTARKERIPFENLPLYRQEIRDAKNRPHSFTTTFQAHDRLSNTNSLLVT